MLRLKPKRWKIISAAQPMLFCFGSASALCSAIAALYASLPGVSASLCYRQGVYYLSVWAALLERSLVARTAAEFGESLGAGRVLYAFYAEHGRELSKNAVAELGGALCGGGKCAKNLGQGT